MLVLSLDRMAPALLLIFLLFGTAAAISGGGQFSRGQAKFAAYIDVPHRKTFCSAVIVSPTHTLSAAVCQRQRRLPEPAVAFAGNNRYAEESDFGPPAQARVVDEWIFHDSEQQTRLDVSLQKLASAWQFNAFVGAIPIANEPELPGDFNSSCVVFGFGCSSAGRKDSGVGRLAPVTVSSWRACQPRRDEGVMCVAGDSAVCAGDEGGPVCCADQQGHARVYGIVLQQEDPAVAYVGFYKLWVVQQTGGVQPLRQGGAVYPIRYPELYLQPGRAWERQNATDDTKNVTDTTTPPGPPRPPPAPGGGETTTEAGCSASLSGAVLAACLAAAALL